MEQSDFENWWNGKEKELKSMGLNFMAISRRRELYKEAWQASRAAVELDLPPRKSAYASGYGDGYLVEHQGGEAIDYEDTVEILRLS